ncbi:SDR family oxidoreductase [Deminuibacter soli]|uniref:SDR family NAD(P)-dependent oxidoreductase n=1 Tax=Deminuibacter soli TaxID=2291815 RepID=A0A3E1NG13_9BACT|nr:SDR family oxidoreductase [Deminuibacter soli]RFM26889.1 SDR family NAD(P)-dependent oxidoreductase [Deminuibacter soli]
MFTIDLSGKVVLISGAGAGIGLGIARQMALAGATVCGADLHPAPGAFAAVLQITGTTGCYTCCDVTSTADLQRWIDTVAEQFGRIDILVSNAGANVFTGAAESSEEDWQRNIDLNLKAHWQLARLCKPWLEQQQGVIILVTSNHAFQSIPGCFPYDVAKTALTGLVRSLAVEWAPQVRTVGIAPGFIDTPGNQQWFDGFADPAQERQRTIGLHPVGKIGTTEEIGGWCVFLSSPYAGFAAGVTYLVDGGRSALMQTRG